MNRSKLKRKSPLRRTRLARKPARRIAQRVRDRPYLAWVHLQPCVGIRAFSYVEYGDGGSYHVCEGRIEASHNRNMTGLGLKAPDSETVPMCSKLHREWEEHRGVFKGWTKEYRRLWIAQRVIEANACYEIETGARTTGATRGPHAD